MQCALCTLQSEVQGPVGHEHERALWHLSHHGVIVEIDCSKKKSQEALVLKVCIDLAGCNKGTVINMVSDSMG